jgi:hypothetical protein
MFKFYNITMLQRFVLNSVSQTLMICQIQVLYNCFLTTLSDISLTNHKIIQDSSHKSNDKRKDTIYTKLTTIESGATMIRRFMW